MQDGNLVVCLVEMQTLYVPLPLVNDQRTALYASMGGLRLVLTKLCQRSGLTRRDRVSPSCLILIQQTPSTYEPRNAQTCSLGLLSARFSSSPGPLLRVLTRPASRRVVLLPVGNLGTCRWRGRPCLRAKRSSRTNPPFFFVLQKEGESA
jgi:hypothetical protein